MARRLTCLEPVERKGHTQPCGRPVDKSETVCAVHLRREAVRATMPKRNPKIGHAANLT